MGEALIYRSRTPLSLEEVGAVTERLRAKFKGFKGFLPGREQLLRFQDVAVLPDWRDRKGVEIGHTIVRGLLPLDVPPYPTFREIFRRAGEVLGTQYFVGVTVGFEEAASRQASEAFDSISVRLRAGRLFFDYSANGSQVMDNPAYSRRFFERLIRTAGLPIAITEEAGHFFLAHSRGGVLEIARGGVRKEDPSSFRCELPGVLPEEAIDRLEAGVSQVASANRFEHSWMAGPSRLPLDRNPEDQKVYEIIRGLGLPAERYRFSAEVYLDDLVGLEGIRDLLGLEDRLTTDLGSVKVGSQRLNLEVVTTSVGHWFDVETKHPIELNELEGIFGVSFEELYPGIG